MIQLNISDYTGQFSTLNGNNQRLNFSTFDIARAFMTVGFPKLSTAISRQGMYRYLELFFRAKAYLKVRNNNFELDPLYKSLDASEQRTISYFIGQSFTKLYAEKKLHCVIVDNVKNHKNNIIFNTNNQLFTPKIQLYSCSDPSSEPDLIGIQSNNKIHVLEAKAHSSGFNGTVLQHAIDQVSRINTVNGQLPLTKSACFFDLSSNPIEGRIVDPDDENKCIDIEFDMKKFKSDYYSLFRLHNFRRPPFDLIPIGANSFVGFRISLFNDFDLFFGLDIDTFDQLNRGVSINLGNKTFPISEDVDLKLFPEFSLGLDGIILVRTERPIEKISKKHWA